LSADGNLTLQRNIVGIVVPITLVVLTMLPLLLFQARLPDPLATHWGTSGQPNDSMSFAFLVVFEFVFVAVPACGLVWSARRNPAHRGQITRLVAVFSFIATTITVTSWGVVAANLDVDDWTRADRVGIAHILGALLIAVLVAGVATLNARRLETAQIPEPVLPSAGLSPGGRGVWVGTARSVWALPIVVALAAIGAYFALTRSPMFGLAPALIGLVALPFVSLRVVADRHGVDIAFGPFGWPKRRIPLANIRRATTLDVVPMEHGGWGYRGSLKLFGRAAVVLRGGEGLQLDLADDKVLTITVDNAEEGAGLLNDLVASSAI
jgi:hypothetical protein